MKKILTSLAVASALSTAAFAESVIVDFSAGGGSISMDQPTVTFGDSAVTTFDLTLDEPSQSYTWAQFDHALPIIPNIRIEQVSMKYTGTATAAVSFNGGTVDTTGTSTLDLSNQDIIAYWGVPFSTWLPMIDEADFGIGLKTFDGLLDVAGVSLNESIDGVLPYGYAKLHISPPFLGGLGFEAEIKTISGGGASFNETILKADWSIEAPIPVIDLEIGIEGGHRSTTLKYDADGSDAFMDLEFTGIFFGLFAKFGI